MGALHENALQANAVPPGTLSGLDKAVAVMSAMGRAVASRLVEHLSEDERSRMLAAAGGLGNLPPHAMEAIVAEFENAFVAGTGAMDNLANLEAVFDRRLAPRAATGPSVWDRAERGAERLSAVLEAENPQLMVVLAAHLSPAAAARMLATLPEARAGEVVRRVASARSLEPAALARVESHLDHLLDIADAAGGDPTRLTAILNELDREMADAFLDGAALPEETAARVRGGLFGFGDLARLTPEDLTTLLDGVEGETLVAALSGVEPELAGTVLGGLSPRTKRMVEAQCAGARVDPTAAEAARRVISTRARELAGEGLIALPDPKRPGD